MAWPPKKKVKIAFQKWMEGNDNEAGRLFSRQWAYFMSLAMLEYYGIRLVERRKVLSLKERVEVIESADYSSSADWE